MTRVALVRNPTSTRNLKGAPAALPEGATLIECASLEDLSPALVEVHGTGAEVLAVDGGDGTVREVLSRLPEIWGGALPRIAIVPRGNTNLIAREVGGVPAGRLAELVAGLDGDVPALSCRRALLRVDRPGRAPLRGFILGWGAYAEGTRLAQDEITGEGTGQVARTVLSVLQRTLAGSHRRRLSQGVATGLALDDGPRRDGPRVIGLVTTLQGPLAARLNPFWGDGPEPMRWLDVRAPARRLPLAAPFLAFGKPRSWMKNAGYLSGRARRITLTLDTPFVMDGEVFDPPEDGPITLSASEEVGFLSL